MKSKILLFIICNLLICNLQFSQSINLTLGSGGVFTLKDASTNYFTLSQSTGQVNILKTLRLENTTSSTTGVIYKGVDRFIHNFGTDNIFMGINSGNFTMTGSNNTAQGNQSLISNTSGSYNAAVGNFSLYSNTTGAWNTAIGNASLYFNTTGVYNIAIGVSSLFANTTGNRNTAVGFSSLNGNTTGLNNTAVGYQSSFDNDIGIQNTALGSESLWRSKGNSNTAVGYQSLYFNTIGEQNTAMGIASLYFNTTGLGNTALGSSSMLLNTTGTFNTGVGLGALGNNTTGSNNTAIGYSSAVPIGTASNQVQIGNTSVTYAGIQVPWTTTSDRRLKSDIQNSALGLGFISKLRPVSYFRNNDESKKTEYGFIAQEVEEVLKETGTENTGMITVTDEGMYELRYNDMLAPMVKAIQELNEKCTTLEAENSQLKSELESLKDMKVKLAELEKSQLELVRIIKSNSSNQTQSINISDNK